MSERSEGEEHTTYQTEFLRVLRKENLRLFERLSGDDATPDAIRHEISDWDRRAVVFWCQLEAPLPGDHKEERKEQRGSYSKSRSRGNSMFMRKLEGKTRQEIANEFDVDVRTVHRQLKETSKRLNWHLPGEAGPTAKGKSGKVKVPVPPLSSDASLNLSIPEPLRLKIARSEEAHAQEELAITMSWGSDDSVSVMGCPKSLFYRLRPQMAAGSTGPPASSSATVSIG